MLSLPGSDSASAQNPKKRDEEPCRALRMKNATSPASKITCGLSKTSGFKDIKIGIPSYLTSKNLVFK